MKNSITSAVLRVVLPYVVIAGLWILLSDWLLVALISDPALRTDVSVAKGWAFVVITALLLSFLLRIELKKREQSELALRASENEIRSNQALLQAVTEGTPDAVFVKDINGNYLMVNSGAARILGKAREEILGKDDTAFFSADDAQSLMAGDRRIMASGLTQTNEELLLINGEPRTFLATKGPVCDPQNRVIGLFGISRDITERKRREKEVERMKRLYAAFSQINQYIVRVHSREELFAKICQALVEFSQFSAAWIGLVDQATKVVNMMAHCGDGAEYLQTVRIYADDRPEGRGPTGRCIREARPYSCNDFVTDPNTVPWREAARKHGWAASFSAPIRQGDAVCGALVVYAKEKNYFGEKESMLLEEVAFDISFALAHIEQEQRRQQAEESLRLSEEKFRLLVEHSPDPIFVQAGDHFAYLNQMAVHLFGARDRGDLLGQPVLDRFHLDYRKAARERIRILNDKKTSVPRSEEICLRLDGSPMPVEVSAVPIHFGGSDGALVFVRDITERKRAAEASQFLAAAVEQAAEAIVMTDITGTIVYVNPAFEKNTGYTRQEALGQTPRLLKSGQQDDAFYKDLWATLMRGDNWRGHFTNKRKDGTIFHEEATISPIRNHDGKITRYVAVKRDVTREMLLERQIIEAQKMDAVGQLAGGVAHDYNNILAASMMQLGMLLTEPNLTPDVQEGLQALKKGADRAANLTRQLLMFGRRQAMQKKPVEMNTLLEDELKMLRRLLGEHIELSVQPRTGDAWIEADPGMIEQVVMNLCINSRDAMPKGGKLIVGVKTVTVDAAAPANSIEARPGKFVCLSVLDIGCGMSRDTMTRIFEPFFTTKEVGKGTGLGLATVYGIVKQHNGWVEVTSEVGKGSEFRVFLPASNAAVSNPMVPAVPKIVRGTETILVVEDEAPLRKSVVMCLKFAGYRVFEAANGPDALQQWREKIGEVDLLLTDMIMPGGMNGLELADVFTKLKPNLQVIITSGYSDEMIQSGIPTKPGFVYLAKPCDTNVLTTTVRQSLDQLKLDRS